MTRLIGEKFPSVMGECDRDVTGVSSIFKVIHGAADLARILPIFALRWAENAAR